MRKKLAGVFILILLLVATAFAIYMPADPKVGQPVEETINPNDSLVIYKSDMTKVAYITNKGSSRFYHLHDVTPGESIGENIEGIEDTVSGEMFECQEQVLDGVQIDCQSFGRLSVKSDTWLYFKILKNN